MITKPSSSRSSYRVARGVLHYLALVAASHFVSAQVSIVPPCPGGGAYPDFAFVQDTGPGAQANTMTIDLSLATTGPWTVPFQDGRAVYDPQEWVVVLYYRDVVIPYGKTVRFRNHGSRAPVAMLATNTMSIQGVIDVSGEPGVLPGDTPRYTEPGPGGFRGALGTAFGLQALTSAGFGPGGGLFGIGASNGTGASYATAGEQGQSAGPAPRPVYGSDSLSYLIGGSGGGGAGVNAGPVTGAGSGGGAILIAADVSIEVGSYASLLAKGGSARSGSGVLRFGGAGSGGSIRVVSDVVVLQGPVSGSFGANLNAVGGARVGGPGGNAGAGGLGRIRIEKNNAGEFPVLTAPLASIEVGQVGAQPLFRSQTLSRIRISEVRTGSNVQSVPVDPRAEIAGSPDLVLTGNATRTFVIEAANTPPTWNVTVRFTKATGVAPQQEVSVPPTGLEGGLNWTRTVDVALPEGIYAVQARAFAP